MGITINGFCVFLNRRRFFMAILTGIQNESDVFVARIRNVPQCNLTCSFQSLRRVHKEKLEEAADTVVLLQ